MIVFEQHYTYNHNPYSWDYLVDRDYKTEFEMTFYIWALGNGNWEGYDTYTNKMYWRDSLIYELT